MKKVKSYKLKFICFFWFLILFVLFAVNSGVFAGSLSDRAFVYCSINLEKKGNQDLLGLLKGILQKNQEESLQNGAIFKAISIVSIKDVKGYAFPENKNGRTDYLVIIGLSDKFSMEVGGRTIEFEVKDKDSLAIARMAALEKLLIESMGGNAKLKSIEILHNKIFFNEEAEKQGKFSSFVTIQGKLVLSNNKVLIRSFIKEGINNGEKIERFGEVTKSIKLQKGGLALCDNKNGDVTKFAQKIATKNNVQVPDFWTKITKAGISFEQISPERIKANFAVQAPKKLSDAVEKEIKTLTEYGNLKIKKESIPNTDYLFILVDFVCDKDAIDKVLGL